MPIDYDNFVYYLRHHIFETDNTLLDCIPAFLVVVQLCRMTIEFETEILQERVKSKTTLFTVSQVPRMTCTCLGNYGA